MTLVTNPKWLIACIVLVASLRLNAHMPPPGWPGFKNKSGTASVVFCSTQLSYPSPSSSRIDRHVRPADYGTEETPLLVDSLVLLSPDSYCRGGNPFLRVTGTNVKWYADANKKIKLADGNTYQAPSLDQTTTFYLTQTLNSVESPVQAITIKIVELIFLSTVVTPASCGKPDGSITVTASGGPNVLYSLDQGPYQPSSLFSNLAAGTYVVNDSVANCRGSKKVTVPQPPSPTITRIDSVAPQCGNTNGSLTITAFGGAGSFRYSLNGVDFQTDHQFTNLAGGTYTVTVNDQNQCTVSQTVSLKKTVKLQVDQVEVLATTCGKSNGRIVVNTQQGNGRITYSINGLPDQLSNRFDSLGAGTYTVSMQDETGCRDTKSVVIDPSAGPAITHIETRPPTCGLADGQIRIAATSLIPLSYRLNEGPYQRDSSFSQLPAASYELTLKDDLDCLIQQSIKLGEPCEDVIYLPDAFTPNQDGQNEGWAIYFPFSDLQLVDLTIFNRWGEIVWHMEPRVLHSGDFLWNGMYKDAIQGGSYTYQMTIQFANGKTQRYRGMVLLIL